MSENRRLELDLAGKQSSIDEITRQMDELKALLKRKEDEFATINLEVQGIAGRY